MMKKLFSLFLIFLVCACISAPKKTDTSGDQPTQIIAQKEEQLPAPDLTEMRALANELEGTQVEMINITVERNVEQQIGAM